MDNCPWLCPNAVLTRGRCSMSLLLHWFEWHDIVSQGIWTIWTHWDTGNSSHILLQRSYFVIPNILKYQNIYLIIAAGSVCEIPAPKHVGWVFRLNSYISADKRSKFYKTLHVRVDRLPLNTKYLEANRFWECGEFHTAVIGFSS